MDMSKYKELRDACLEFLGHEFLLWLLLVVWDQTLNEHVACVERDVVLGNRFVFVDSDRQTVSGSIECHDVQVALLRYVTAGRTLYELGLNFSDGHSTAQVCLRAPHLVWARASLPKAASKGIDAAPERIYWIRALEEDVEAALVQFINERIINKSLLDELLSDRLVGQKQ